MPGTTTAADVMVTKLVTVTPEMNVMDAVELLLSHKISGAPVVDQTGGLVGILSELDCVNHMCQRATEQLPPLDVVELMTRNVVTVTPDTTLLTLAHLFTTKGFRRLPVVDAQGTLLGQVSRRDLLVALRAIMAAPIKEDAGPLYLSAVLDEAPAKVRGFQRSRGRKPGGVR